MAQHPETIDTNRRIGRVRVSDVILRKSFNTGEAALIFAGAVPLDVQRDWTAQHTDYLLWHPAFDAISEGQVVPHYVASITRGENDTFRISWTCLGAAPSDWHGITADMLKRDNRHEQDLVREHALDPRAVRSFVNELNARGER